MMKKKLIVALSVIFALSLSVLCFASCDESEEAEKPTYTVSFETDGGSSVEAQKVERGAKATKPADPTKEGYTFTAWYLGEEEYDFDTAVKESFTLTAHWQAVVRYYTVTFDTAGGSSVAEQSVVSGQSAERPEAPTKDGYAFKGWYVGETAYEFGAVTENTTVTAHWAKLYTVTWLNYDGTELKTDTLEEGEVPAYTGTPAREETAQYTYNFSGWDKELTAVSADVTYTAQYEETTKKYTVTWLNGEENLVAPEEYEYGAMPSYKGETPEKAGTAQYTYTHNGWTPEITSVTGDATYTATFDETVNKYTVTFMNGEVELSHKEYEYGAMPAYDGTPTKDSTAQYTYAFTGWDKELTAVSADVTYTAQFDESIRNYAVTFDTNGGDAIDAEEYAYGTSTANLPETTKADSTFLRWTLNNGDPLPETITEDITVKAVWGIGVATNVNINSKADFLAIGNGYDAKELPFITYKLTTDLSFDTADYTPWQWREAEHFEGGESATWERVAYLVQTLNVTLDGNGHTISTNYNKGEAAEIRNAVEAYPALFYTIGENGEVKNLKINAFTLTNFEATSVARYNYGLVENCYVDATHVLQHEASRINGPDLQAWFQTNTAEIVANYGTVKNCVFKISTSYADGTVYHNSYAVRHTYDGGTFKDCIVIGRDATKQFISTNYANLAYFGGDPAFTVANVDSIRDNCYVFASVANLLSGDGGKYNADGTITAGTYTSVKDLYTGSYWDAWLV